jgi:stage II sporulation protein M
MTHRSIRIIIENRSWLLLATVFFLSSAIFSYIVLIREPELLAIVEETSFPFLQEMAELVFGGPPLRGSLILFLHNITSSLQVIAFGLILGIPALFSVIANGALVGVAAAGLAREGIPPLSFFLSGILPHGILEIPAFLLSAAFGLKLGYHIVFPLPGKKRLQSLGQIFIEVGEALPLIIALLAAAALIEVFLTPGLIQRFITK